MPEVPSPEVMGQPRDLNLLVELAPRSFFGNLKVAFTPARWLAHEPGSASAPFWPDVFVHQPLPWRRFAESVTYHLLAFGSLVVLSHFAALQPRAVVHPTFERSQVIYYEPSEYLPPLDTRNQDDSQSQKADPEFSPQPIISVPPEADNHTQTIVTAPNVRLQHDVPLPNMVAWSDQPQLPIAPAPLVPAAEITRMTPQMESSVVAPPPDARVQNERELLSLQTSIVAPPPEVTNSARSVLQAPQASVIAPPPSVDNAVARPIGEMNIAPSAIVAPAPRLAVPEQRALPGALVGTAAAPQVIPPPPALLGSRSGNGGGRLLALNLHPSVGAPPEPPAGNRRGSFAATPGGHTGASGTPGASAGSPSATGSGTGNAHGNGGPSGSNAKNGNLPSGLYVGSGSSAKTSPVAGDPAPASSTPAVNPKLVASLPPPRVSTSPTRTLEPGNEARLTESERAIFAGRRFYSLMLNMPNLNSAGGSWVIRFAERKGDAAPGNLSAPYATRKVDPAYPLQLMKENVAGTVILYAIIHADGSVGEVRVLRSVDDRIDRFAQEAVSQWKFQPATKNGAPVDVEATFQVPFKPASNF